MYVQYVMYFVLAQLISQVRERLRSANEKNVLLEDQLLMANQEVHDLTHACVRTHTYACTHAHTHTHTHTHTHVHIFLSLFTSTHM